MEAWGITDKGMVRTQNQDSFFLDVLHKENFGVCVVSDGMGGARAGNIASEIAVTTFIEEIRQNYKSNMNQKYTEEIADKALYKSNRKVYDKSKSDAEFYGMGTTLVGAIIFGNEAVVINVGDSRAYLIDSDGIVKITHDHSVVEDMLDKGEITQDEARIHPSRNLITRALGTEIDVEGDIYYHKLQNGSFLLLCSDGLSNMIEDQEILYEVLHGGEPGTCCSRLLNIANTRGGPDNITVVLVLI